MAKKVEILDNPARFAEELTSKLRDYKLPGIEIDAVVRSQRKNAEALANVSRAALENVQAVAKRQAEILQETMNQIAKSLGTLARAGSPSEVAAKQTELAKEAFEIAFGNLRELTEMIRKGQQEAIDKISDRISESLDEIKQMTLNIKQPAAEDNQPTGEADS